MSDNVVSFPVPPVTAAKTLETIPDTDHNRNSRNDQGPPIGTQAYMCDCGCFAFYFSLTETVCYECHAVHTF